MNKHSASHQRRVSLRDVATEAGVSVATVSRVLNHHTAISEATRNKVMSAVENLGYRPDPEFSRLMASYRAGTPRSEASTIAFVNCWPASLREGHPSEELNLYFQEAKKRADQFGYKLEEFSLREKSMPSKRLEKILYARRIRGVLIPPIPDISPWVSPFEWNWDHFSLCTIGYSLQTPRLNCVSTHHYHDILKVIRICNEYGYRRLGLALGPTHDNRVEHLWLAGFSAYQCFIKNSQKVPILLTKGEHVNVGEFTEWVLKEKPDVILTPQKRSLEWMQNMRLNVPEQIGIALLAVDADDSITSGLKKNASFIASRAVDNIIAQINRGESGIPKSPVISLIDATWSKGTTVRAVAEPQPLPLDGCPSKQEM